MKSQSQYGDVLPWPALIGLIIAGWGMLMHQPGVESQRPVAPQGQSARMGIDQPIARLWQDPMDAIRWARARGTPGEGAESRRPLGIDPAATLRRHIEQMEDLLVIPVLLPGMPFVEDGERRLRTRYAVQAAMARANMLPRDHEWLRVVTIDTGERSQAPEAPQTKEGEPPLGRGRPMLVPYEWFSFDLSALGRPVRQTPPSHNALVLWLDEVDLENRRLLHGGGSSIEMIDFIVGQLLAGVDTLKKVTVRVVGPTSSDRLDAMIHRTDPHTVKRRIKVFSPWATYTGAGGERIEAPSDDEPVIVVRTAGTDDRLCELLVAELRRRRVVGDAPVQPRTAPIVLLGEWETVYGRSLRMNFFDSLLAAGADPEYWVEEYGYLRGLDGELPPRAESEQAETSSQNTSDLLMGAPAAGSSATERAESRRQIDYIVRIAQNLRARRGSVQAVGIFGSDVYDKMVLLRALKRAVPGAVFFTTDLDARLCRRSEYRFTRNLVIASHFGLTLDLSPVREQLSIPPLRDSYETAVFAATLRVLDFNEAAPGAGERWTYPSPRLYEIGASGALPLDGPRRGTALSQQLRWPKPLWLLGSAVLIAMLIVFARRARDGGRSGAPEQQWEELGRALRRAVVGTAIGGVAIWALIAVIDRVSREPIYLMEGISAWPSIGLRAAALALTVWYCRLVIRELFDVERRLARRYRLNALTCGRRKIGWPWLLGGVLLGVANSRWRRSYGITGYPTTTPEAAGRGAAARELWRRYAMRAAWPRRFERVNIFVVGVVLLAALLYSAMGLPRAPTRDWLSTAAHWTIFTGSLVAVNTLSFLILDAARLAGRYIESVQDAQLTYRPGADAPVALANEEPQLAGAVIDIEIVTELARTVNKTLKYPFVVLLLLAVAGLQIFDSWVFSLASLLVFGLSAVVATLASIVLSRTAQQARDDKIRQVRERLARDRIAAAGSTRNSKKAERARLAEEVLAGVQARYSRPFLPLYQLPIITAVLVPAAGIVIVQLLRVLQ